MAGNIEYFALLPSPLAVGLSRVNLCDNDSLQWLSKVCPSSSQCGVCCLCVAGNIEYLALLPSPLAVGLSQVTLCDNGSPQ